MFEISELENGREGVRVTGEVDIYTATQFKEPIEKLIEANTKDIFLDLTDLSYIDSTGIGILIELRKGSMSRDLNMTLKMCIRDRVTTLSRITLMITAAAVSRISLLSDSRSFLLNTLKPRPAMTAKGRATL